MTASQGVSLSREVALKSPRRGPARGRALRQLATGFAGFFALCGFATLRLPATGRLAGSAATRSGSGSGRKNALH